MGLWSTLTGNTDNRSGQQRRAADNRAADRAGRRQIDSHRTSKSTTAWNPDRTGRRWWQSS